MMNVRMNDVYQRRESSGRGGRSSGRGGGGGREYDYEGREGGRERAYDGRGRFANPMPSDSQSQQNVRCLTMQGGCGAVGHYSQRCFANASNQLNRLAEFAYRAFLAGESPSWKPSLQGLPPPPNLMQVPLPLQQGEQVEFLVASPALCTIVQGMAKGESTTRECVLTRVGGNALRVAMPTENGSQSMQMQPNAGQFPKVKQKAFENDPSMECAGCKQKISMNAKFCLECGKAVVKHPPILVECVNCKEQNSQDAKFCSQCGEAIVSGQKHELWCSKCKMHIPKGGNFCPKCGANPSDEKEQCCKCQAQLTTGAKFCHNCRQEVGKHKGTQKQKEAKQGDGHDDDTYGQWAIWGYKKGERAWNEQKVKKWGTSVEARMTTYTAFTKAFVKVHIALKDCLKESSLKKVADALNKLNPGVQPQNLDDLQEVPPEI